HTFEQGRFAGTVVAHKTNRLTFVDGDVDVFQRPKVVVRDAAEVNHPLFQRRVLLVIQTETLRDILDFDSEAHSSSAKLPSWRPKTTSAKYMTTQPRTPTAKRCSAYQAWL